MIELEHRPEVRYETITTDKKLFGRNNILEISKKKAITPDGELIVVMISQGLVLPNGTEIFKKTLVIPDDKDLKNYIIEKLKI